MGGRTVSGGDIQQRPTAAQNAAHETPCLNNYGQRITDSSVIKCSKPLRVVGSRKYKVSIQNVLAAVLSRHELLYRKKWALSRIVHER